MGELITIFMVFVFIVGMSIVVKDVIDHAKKHHLTKRSSGPR